MTKKYVLTAAIAGFLAAANIAEAPINMLPISPKLERIILKDSHLEKYIKENEKKLKELLKEFNDIKNYRTDDFKEDSLELLTARLMMGETEDYSVKDKMAVAWTVLNRLKIGDWYGKTFHEVALKPFQYSCFNEGTESNAYLKIPLRHNKKDFLKNLKISEDFWKGKYKDPTNGATHYYNPKKVKTPKWVKGKIFCGRIGDHLFYKNR